MTEISDAAFKRADELAKAEAHGFYDRDNRKALARHIQMASDVAKAIDDNINRHRITHGWSPDYLVLAQTALQSLILPEEPCKHTLKVSGLDHAFAHAEMRWLCAKCGATLKIVEADRDD